MSPSPLLAFSILAIFPHFPNSGHMSSCGSTTVISSTYSWRLASINDRILASLQLGSLSFLPNGSPSSLFAHPFRGPLATTLLGWGVPELVLPAVNKNDHCYVVALNENKKIETYFDIGGGLGECAGTSSQLRRTTMDSNA
ncbi:hypothetical protein M758_UG343900 [Ceratodon purpureus]|nr:hypothetical protein M758_UG343900 [Ceratodon purpureus]